MKSLATRATGLCRDRLARSSIVASLFAIVLAGCNIAARRAPAEVGATSPTSGSSKRDRSTPKPIQVAAGDRATCALFDDGAVWCWGKLDYVIEGRLSPPTRMTDVPAARRIAVGSDGCAITRDGAIVCGWLGSGLYTVTGIHTPAEIAVAERGEAACATDGDGMVACWEPPRGRRRTPPRTSDAIRVDGVGPGVELKLGEQLGCVVHRDERKLQCWSPIGPVAVESTPSGPIALAGEDGCAVDGSSIHCAAVRKIDAAAFGEIAEIGLSNNGVCGRSTAGVVFCATRGGRFAPPDDVVAGAHALATKIELPASAQLTVGPTHACSLSVAGEIHCWGDDAVGQASGRSMVELPPSELPIGDFKEIALGGSGRTCVLSSDTVACTDSGATCPTGELETVRAQSWHESLDEHWSHAHVLGSGHGVCVASRREKAVWDRPPEPAGRARKPGSPRRTSPSSRRRVEHAEFLVCLESAHRKEVAYRLPQGTLDRAAQLLLGHGFLCLLTPAGGVECAELGDRTHSSPRTLADTMSADDDAALRFVPKAKLPTAKALVEVIGYGDACALTTEGDTFCWRGIEAPRRVSTSVAKSIAGGRDRLCQLDTDGHIGCSEMERPRERVAGIERAQSLAVGDRHGCAIDEHGRVRCWDMEGHFADDEPQGNAPRHSSAPVELPGAATALFAGGGTSCARLASGRVFCWGDNAGGRLGVGISTCRARPVRVSIPGLRD